MKEINAIIKIIRKLKDGNGGSVISTGDIDNANPKQAHYMVKQITEDSTVVYGEENGYMYNYLKQENGTYNLSQKKQRHHQILKIVFYIII